MTSDDWMQGLHNKLKEMHSIKNWKDVDDIGNELKEWVAKNPRPPVSSPHIPKPPAPKGVHGVGNMNKQIDAAQTFYRLRGSRGFINLAALVAVGTTSAAAIGTAVLTYFAEEAVVGTLCFAWEYAGVIGRGTTPTTQQECHERYNDYCRQLRYSAIGHKLGYIDVAPEKNWFEITYGVSYGSLK